MGEGASGGVTYQKASYGPYNQTRERGTHVPIVVTVFLTWFFFLLHASRAMMGLEMCIKHIFKTCFFTLNSGEQKGGGGKGITMACFVQYTRF